jgi:hypothetical protein
MRQVVLERQSEQLAMLQAATHTLFYNVKPRLQSWQVLELLQ